jgi:hypothetical protein
LRQTIRLGEGDGYPVARYKLEGAQSRRVALVVPAGNRVLRNRAELTLIRRAAEALALDLVLVAGSPELAGLARSVGLRVARSEGLALRLRGRRAQLPGLARGSVASEGVPPPPQARRVTADEGQPRLQQAVALVGALAAVLVLALGFVVLVPSAAVTLDPVGNRADAEAEIVASMDVLGVDYSQARVPLRHVEIEAVGTETGQATGMQSVPDQHATGEVVFANKSTEAVAISKGTVVRTADGEPVRFYTLLDVEVPASFGAVARVPVMAFEPGPAGNVEALTIRAVEGEAGYRVDVLNDQPTRGGTDKRVSIVSLEDNDRLRATLMQRLQQESYSRLVSQLAVGEWVPPDTLELAIVEEAFDRRVDEPAETLSLTMTVRVSGLAVDGQATRDLMVSRLEAQSGGGREVNEGTLRVDQPVGKVDVAGQVVRFRATASAILVEPVDRRAVGTHLAGQDLQTALSWLGGEFDLRQAPQIRTSPSWWRRMPWLPTRISVELSGGL